MTPTIHRRVLALRALFADAVSCPQCGAAEMFPCIGLAGGLFAGIELNFHHLQRLIATSSDWVEYIPLITTT